MEKIRAEGDENDELTHATGIPQSPSLPCKLMESLFVKLKLLNYKKSFCRQQRIKEISKTYFAFPTKPAEQFHTFVNLATWLINQSGHVIEIPQEFEDSDAIITKILEAFKYTVGHSLEFPISKLKTGSGELCIRVLDLLADSALKFKRVRCKPSQINKECHENGKAFDAFDEDDMSVIAQEIICNPEVGAKTGLSKPQALEQSVFREETFLGVEPTCKDPQLTFNGLLTSSSRNPSPLCGTPLPDLPQMRVEGDDWQMELERVLPQLHLTSKSGIGGYEWQIHLEKFKQYWRSIENCFAESREHVKHLEEELLRDINKISNREMYINSQVKDALEDYGLAQARLNELKETYEQANAGIAERSATLTKLNEDIEKVKAEMEQRGSCMSDSSPVIRIRQAIQRLKAENVAMEIRIGVLEHALLRSQLRAREESQKHLLMRPNSLDAFRSTGENEII